MARPYNPLSSLSGSARRKLEPSTRESERRRRRKPAVKARERRRYAWSRVFRFATVDGEAADGRYVLLGVYDPQADEHHELYRPAGIGTLEALQFLTQLERRTLWGFAFDYDTNQILNGLGPNHLTNLARHNRCYFGDFRLEHIPGKILRVTDREQGRTVTVWDAFSYIRTSFARWLESWHLAPARELERIRRMKDLRPVFKLGQIRSIRAYNRAELVYLAAGVEELLRRIRAAGYKPSSWHSPGSIAAAALRSHNVGDHMRPATDPVPEAVRQAATEAYFGGRFETRVIGEVEGPLYHFDLNSAYPAAAARLPCLACGTWEAVLRPDLDEPDSLLFVAWRPRRGESALHERPPFGPFPVRIAAGSLRYPLSNPLGGWYWSSEVRAGASFASLKILKGWRFVRGCDHAPFSFLVDLYEKRRALKGVENPVEYTYKLILNSCYGKLAQRPRRGRTPRFHEPLWSGSITATCRAALLSAIGLEPRAVVQLATDGLTSYADLPLPISGELGDWSRKLLADLFIVQSGIYFWREQGGEVTQRSRGFHPSSLTLEVVRAHFARAAGLPLTLRSERFVGYRTALHRGALEAWRTWAEFEVHLGTRPEPRRDTLRVEAGRVTSAPILRAKGELVDELMGGTPFEQLADWELEQPDGPEGEGL